MIGTGNDPFTPGFRHVDAAALVPSIESPDYPGAVREVVKQHEIDAILTFADPDTVALANLRHELSEAGVACFFPGPRTTKFTYDKLETARWAEENGFVCPRTVTDWDGARATFGASFVAKPRTGSASSGVLFIRPNDDRSILAPDVDYIFQEQLLGEEINLELLGDLNGSPVGLSLWRKLRSRHGETELAVTFRDDALLSYAERLSSTAEMIGPCDVDLMLVDDEIYLIEFNARFGGGYPTSDLAGAQFPEKLIAMARGESLELSVEFEPDIFMMKSLQPFGGRIADHKSLLHLDE